MRTAAVDVPVYVISLPDAEVRRRNMATRLSAAGIPFRFFDAVDGRTRQIGSQIDGAELVRDAFDTEYALACTASHRLVHRTIANGDSDLALVFEDDAALNPRPRNRSQSILPRVSWSPVRLYLCKTSCHREAIRGHAN